MIFVVVGPSGAGKDTLIAGARAQRPDLHVVRRVITRPAEAGGEEFEGVSSDEFRRRSDAGCFALQWQAHGLSYGIPKHQVGGRGDILFNGSRAALPAALSAFPDLRVILVTAPPDMLSARLALRGREAETDIGARLDRAGLDLPEGVVAAVVVNDGSPEAGISRLLAALQPVSA